MARRRNSTGYVRAKVRANTARKARQNGLTQYLVQDWDGRDKSWYVLVEAPPGEKSKVSAQFWHPLSVEEARPGQAFWHVEYGVVEEDSDGEEIGVDVEQGGYTIVQASGEQKAYMAALKDLRDSGIPVGCSRSGVAIGGVAIAGGRRLKPGRQSF